MASPTPPKEGLLKAYTFGAVVPNSPFGGARGG